MTRWIFSISVMIAIVFSAPSLARAAGHNQFALDARDFCLEPASVQADSSQAQDESFFAAILARCQADAAAEERAWLEYLAAGGDRPEVIIASQPENLPLTNITASLFPDNPVVYYRLAELLNQNGEKARALQAYWRVAALNPRDGRNWVRLARLYEAQGDWQTALIFFDRGCWLRDTGGNGCPNAARLYLSHGFPSEAERCYRLALLHLPGRESYLLGLAEALFQQNRPEEARELLIPLQDAGSSSAIELMQKYESLP